MVKREPVAEHRVEEERCGHEQRRARVPPQDDGGSGGPLQAQDQAVQPDRGDEGFGKHRLMKVRAEEAHLAEGLGREPGLVPEQESEAYANQAQEMGVPHLVE